MIPVVVWALVVQSAVVVMAGEEPEGKLEPGKPVVRPIKKGETQVYTIDVTAGQYLYVEADQRGVDLVLTLTDPDGKTVYQEDFGNRFYGFEPAYAIAEKSGTYRLKVESPTPPIEPGDFTLRIVELRPEAPGDRDFLSATQYFRRYQRQNKTREMLLEARSGLMRAREVFERVGNHWWEAGTCDEIGFTFAIAGEPHEAIAFQKRGLKLLEGNGDLQAYANLSYNLASTYRIIGEYQSSRKLYDWLIEYAHSTRQQHWEANVATSLGDMSVAAGSLRAALPEYQRSLRIWRERNETRRVSVVLGKISRVYFQWRDYKRAIEYLNSAISGFRVSNDYRFEGTFTLDIGKSWLALDNQDRARSSFLEAQRLLTLAGDRDGIAQALDALGQLESEAGNRERALACWTQAIELATSLANRFQEAKLRINLGNGFSRFREYDRAIEQLSRAEGMLAGDPVVRAAALKGLAEAYRGKNELAAAKQTLEAALVAVKSVGAMEEAADVLYRLARLGRESGNIDESLARIRAAIDLDEASRTEVKTPEQRATFFISTQDHYRFLANLLTSLPKPDVVGAFAACEQTRTRSLLEILAANEADQRREADPRLIEREAQCIREITTDSSALFALESTDSPEKDALKRSIDTRTLELETIRAEIRRTLPGYATTVSANPLTLREIQSSVLDDETVLVQFMLDEDRGHVWVVTRTAIDHAFLPNRATIEAAVRNFLDGTAGGRSIGRDSAEFEAAGTRLGRMLFGEIAAKLQAKRLLIVPDGGLFSLPFPLLSLRGTPLVVRHEVVVLPSASSLAVIRQTVGRDKKPSKTVAVFANPVFSMSSNPGEPGVDFSRREQVMSAFGELAPLPETERQATVIRDLVGTGQSFIAVGYQATKEAVLSAREYRIIHFATHGRFDGERPELSGLVLSLFDEKGAPRNGYLLMSEIATLNLKNTDLVVLGACETALGKRVAGEGVVGIARAFMTAGAPRVIASLWKVGEKTTTELMGRFYRNLLKKKMTPAAALRAAQVSMWQDPRWRDRRDWAAFQLQGEYR